MWDGNSRATTYSELRQQRLAEAVTGTRVVGSAKFEHAFAYHRSWAVLRGRRLLHRPVAARRTRGDHARARRSCAMGIATLPRVPGGPPGAAHSSWPGRLHRIDRVW